jgi:hypothetical protein
MMLQTGGNPLAIGNVCLAETKDVWRTGVALLGRALLLCGNFAREHQAGRKDQCGQRAIHETQIPKSSGLLRPHQMLPFLLA